MPNLNPRTDGKEYPIWMIHGPSGSGKTRAAATASSHHALKAKGDRLELINLTDMLWLLFDKDGLQSIQSQGMEPLYYDFSYMVPDLPRWQLSVYSKLDEAKGKIDSQGVKFVVVDTLSSICEYYDAYFLGNAGKDPRLAYNASLQAFRQLLLKLRALPCPQIWLCHSRSAYVDPDKMTDQQRVARTATLPGEFDIDLALTNGWKQTIRGMTNLTMGLDVDHGGKRYFITEANGTPKWYVKNRYDDLLKPREPVDLRSIFDRIDNFDKTLRTPRNDT